MRVDVLTIFPQYFQPLELSLVGKARKAGRFNLTIHDLREWTNDPHRTVDGPQAGGGPGMVMRADVWGRALDEVIDENNNPILIVPTPAGKTLTQSTVEYFAQAEQLVFACGRYEGIDERVVNHYQQRGVQVFEVSLGDFILNGGEVAALAAIEATVRMIPGVVSNPDSLADDSFSGRSQLLDYPAYTKPNSWRGADIPEVLLSGDHQRVARWRWRQQLRRTANLRPDLIVDAIKANESWPENASDDEFPTREDHDLLIRDGMLLVNGSDGNSSLLPCRLQRAALGNEEALAEIAQLTFPDACPPSLSAAEIDAHIAAHLDRNAFARMLTNPAFHIWMMSVESKPIGFFVAIMDRRPEDDEEARNVKLRLDRNKRVAEISKCYVAREYRGTAVAGALMNAALKDLASLPQPVQVAWLGTNRSNRRAIGFYEKCGFAIRGSRDFLVGDQWQDDVLLTRGKVAQMRSYMED